MNNFEQYRRRFLGGALATAGAAMVPGLMLVEMAHSRAPEEPVSSRNRWGLLIDTTKCATGCTECVTACNTENGLSGKTGPQDSQWIRKVELTHKKTGAQHSLPVMCQHCEEPPCVDVCPTGASFKRDDGIVLVDRHICIGCRYCMMACPYKARSLVHEDLNDTQLAHMPRGKGCVESCTLCVHKIDAGENTTACAEACPEQAILFGDLNDAGSEIARRLATYASKEIRADLGLNTGVRYTGI
ncbi:MAG: sulfate reduction electron transfer complex DsrMKJOP subunit DsrO [Pseudomonadota bacterium]